MPIGGAVKIWLDDVNCKGTEEHILECAHPGIGAVDCQQQNIVSVQCRYETGKHNIQILKNTSIKYSRDHIGADTLSFCKWTNNAAHLGMQTFNIANNLMFKYTVQTLVLDKKQSALKKLKITHIELSRDHTFADIMDDLISDRSHSILCSKMAARRKIRHTYIFPICNSFHFSISLFSGSTQIQYFMKLFLFSVITSSRTTYSRLLLQ